MNVSKSLKQKVILVSVFLGIVFSFLLINISVLIASLCQQSNGIEKIRIHRINLNNWSAILKTPKEYLNNWSFIGSFTIVIIISIIIIFYLIAKYNIQLFIIFKNLNNGYLWPLDIVLGIALLFSMFFSNAMVSNTALLATIITFCSSSILIPIARKIVDIPLIDVEIMDYKFMYDKNDLELNSTDSIIINAMNKNDNPQIIKFLGFCKEENIDSIRENYTKFNRYIFLPQNKLGAQTIGPEIETIDSHAVSKKRYYINLSEIILALKSKYNFNEKKATIAAIYRNEEGNIFFKKFIVINSNF